MADISKIKFGSTEYNIKDAVARASVTGALHFIGTTRTPLHDLANTLTLAPASSGSLSKTSGFSAGDLVIFENKEFVWTGELWSEFGSTGSLKALAFKSEAKGTINIADGAHIHSIPLLTHTVTQGTVNAGGTCIPKGKVNITNEIIESSTENESGGFTGTTEAKRIGEGDKILTNTETVDVTITPVGGTTKAHHITNTDTMKMFTASISGEMLTLTPGVMPTVDEVDVATAGTDKTFKAVNTSDWGMPGATHPTIAEMINASFSGDSTNVSVSGSTSGVAVEDHNVDTDIPNETTDVEITVS